MPADPNRVRDVFRAAVALPPDQRPVYLAEACRGDVVLRAEVDRLLAATTNPDGTLDPATPATEQATGAFTPGDPATVALSSRESATEAFDPNASRPMEILTEASGPDEATGYFAQRVSGATTARESASPAPGAPRGPSGEGIGTVIAGRYTLVEVIGEGGMGSVYLASQTEPVKRQVALKLIKTGMDSRGVLARFDAERQALALMDHPNIARIYDGGVTPAGQPFFVMELVQGVPLTEYCDAKRLSVQARLELFVAVCQAVQHAHQKGIIHRDLKPGNVLVTEVDGRATPKVIDFGVAKATEVKLTDMSLADVGAIVGTPAYMSPEQADPSSMDIDTRTDVYALGVILYELLVGSPPLEARNFRRGAILEMLRMVREVDPPRPSTKLSTAEALPNIAANRSIDPSRLSKLLEGELDWVVMKALEKDRNRRYDTANGFARDIQKYLADEVVEARPPSRGYRLRKFIKRNKIQVIAASLVFLTLVGGIVGTSLGLYQADRARDAETTQRKIAVEQKQHAEAAEAVATVQRSRAEKREEQAIDAVKKFRDAVANNPELKNNPALESLRKTLLKEPLAFFRSLRASLQADADTNPESIARLAEAAHDYAHITEEIGDKNDSLRGHSESQEIWERLTRDHPQNTEFDAGLAKVHFCQGKLLSDTGRHAEAKKSYESAVAIYKTLTSADPNNSYLQKQFALSQARRAILHQQDGRLIEAMQGFESAVAIFENLIKTTTTNVNENLNYRSDLAGIFLNMGVLQHDTGHHAEALSSYGKALSIWRKLDEDFPGSVVDTQSNLGRIYHNIGTLQMDTGKPAEAMKSLESALAVWRRLTDANPTVTDFQDSLASTYMLIAGLQDGTEALESQRVAAAIWRKLIDGHPTVPAFRSSLAGALHNMAGILYSQGRNDEALALFELARSYSEEAVRADGSIDHYQENLANHLDSIGIILWETGKPAEAIDAYRRGLEIRQKLTDKYPGVPSFLNSLAGTQHNLARATRSNGDKAQALQIYKKARSNSEAAVRADGTNTQFQMLLSYHLWAIGKLLQETGMPADALESCEQALAIRRRLGDEHSPDPGVLKTLADYNNDIGTLKQSFGKPVEAMASYEQCRVLAERLTSMYPESPDFACCLSGTLSNMAEIDIDAKRFEEARSRLRTAIMLQKKALVTAPKHPTCRRYLAIHLDLLIKTAKVLGRTEEAAEAQRDLDELKASDPR